VLTIRQALMPRYLDGTWIGSIYGSRNIDKEILLNFLLKLMCVITKTTAFIWQLFLY